MSVIEVKGACKTYALYQHGIDRLIEFALGTCRHKQFTALRPLDLTVDYGEVLGIVGMNGAGKSTLLKLLAGTLAPSSGSVHVAGLVAALLELGAGFHPELTGRDNVYLYASVLGLKQEAIERLYPEIVRFSGLEAFMNQPVKTYSSGMFVRLAFAVATSVEPDVLIVDEALSVGDGAFARRSFERIMGFRQAGKTIIFCSHSLYQIEAICTRALWLHQGEVVLDASPAEVTAAYSRFLQQGERPIASAESDKAERSADSAVAPSGHARILAIKVWSNAEASRQLDLRSGIDDLDIEVTFLSDPNLPTPTVGIALAGADGHPVCSALSLQDHIDIPRDESGKSIVKLCFNKLPLLKGIYTVQVYLACENAIHAYDQVLEAAEVRMTQNGLEQGVVSLPRKWHV